jgi:hypothetical protein
VSLSKTDATTTVNGILSVTQDTSLGANLTLAAGSVNVTNTTQHVRVGAAGTGAAASEIGTSGGLGYLALQSAATTVTLDHGKLTTLLGGSGSNADGLHRHAADSVGVSYTGSVSAGGGSNVQSQLSYITAAVATKALASDLTNLTSTVAGKAASGHTHTQLDITQDASTATDQYLLFVGASSTGQTVKAKSGTAKLSYIPSTGVVSSTDFTATSDVRLKTDIATIQDAAWKVNQLRGVTFRRLDVPDRATHMGVIAQEVAEVVPEVVHTSSDGILSVAYGNLVGLLIEAIKAQDARITQLESQLKR